MLKRIFFIFLTILLCFCLVFSPLSASAYEVTGFEITAKAGMLISLDTEEILFSKNIDKKVYPASIAKIMSAILILESDRYHEEEKITMTEEIDAYVTGTGLSVSNIKVGEQITHLDLIYTVLMSSFADCTYLAAIHVGGSVAGFVDMMNAKAQELGLTGTHYSNPVGLHEEETYTTVKDIYTLTKYALKNETFKKVCSANRYEIQPTNMSGKRILSTTNFLLDSTTNYYYQYAKGVKTGFTDEAGRCLVSTASYNGYNYMCILMGCPDSSAKRYHFSESADLYRWAFNNFAFKEIADSNEPVCEMPLELSMETDFVPLYFKKPFVSVLPKEADESTIVIKPKLKYDSVKAPVKRGQVLGEAEVIYAENVIGRVNLVAGEDIKANTLLKGVDFLKGIFTSVYLKVIYAIIGIAILIFVILCIKINYSKLKKRKVRYIPYNGKERNNRK